MTLKSMTKRDEKIHSGPAEKGEEKRGLPKGKGQKKPFL